MDTKPIRLRLDRFILFLLSLALFIIMSDCARRYFNERTNKYASISIQVRVQGKTFGNTTATSVNSGTEKNNEYNNSFTELDIDNSQVFSGELIEVNYQKPYVSAEIPPTVNLISYRNDYYTLINDTDPVILNAEAAEALNIMMEDYYKSTGQSNFLIYGTTDTYTGEGSYCPYAFPESITGNTIDVAVNVGSSVLTYDGCDVEKWIVENCYKYGYIVRFPENKSEKTGFTYCPWHLRYVGKVHAEVMHELGCCFEEYLELLDTYTYNHPLYYNMNGSMYYIYTAKSAGQTTKVCVPAQSEYTISGDNTDSFVITSLRC
ncbi:MAG: D-alanyl-D-alanine carboxypeptidase family protein [Ruminococcus sp.]|nr:D-alanyl-D-alanine carboxypeptidase family protein [Ruminococcus sp.]MDE6796888.1 D-alanyl-D-alanine carboxypeptidase family protein [Ruminococcus sp.]